jgi:CheY-like chemotaxis protein
MPTRTLIRMIRTILAGEKGSGAYDVVETGTGIECLRIHDAQGPFDLILLDVNLPDMDGFEVCRSLRRVDDRVPIVFVTSREEVKDHAAVRSARGDLLTSVARTPPRTAG